MQKQLRFVDMLNETTFESSSGLTPQFDHFYRVFRNDFAGYLRSLGATNVQMKRGHFGAYGFFTIPGHRTPAREGWSEAVAPDQAWYFSIGDVRWNKSMFIRKARNYGDYTGGRNQAVPLTGPEDFDHSIRRILKEGDYSNW